MSQDTSKKNVDNLPSIINTLAVTIVSLAFIYAAYSYLVIQLQAEAQPTSNKLVNLQLQLKQEQAKSQQLQQENNNLLAAIEQKEQRIKQLRMQLEEESKLTDQLITPQCSVVKNKDITDKLLRKALHQTLSRTLSERFEGFSILMNKIDYLDESLQKEIIEFYLGNMNKKHKVGVYYATFIMSELAPQVLRAYEPEIESAYRSIYQQPGWEMTSYKYCQIESKMDSYYQLIQQSMLSD